MALILNITHPLTILMSLLPMVYLVGMNWLGIVFRSLKKNRTFRVTCYGEPQLGKRGLYPNLSIKQTGASVETMMDFIAYADETNDLVDISNIIRKPVWEIVQIAEKLLEAGLLEEIKEEKLIG